MYIECWSLFRSFLLVILVKPTCACNTSRYWCVSRKWSDAHKLVRALKNLLKNCQKTRGGTVSNVPPPTLAWIRRQAGITSQAICGNQLRNEQMHRVGRVKNDTAKAWWLSEEQGGVYVQRLDVRISLSCVPKQSAEIFSSLFSHNPGHVSLHGTVHYGASHACSAVFIYRPLLWSHMPSTRLQQIISLCSM